MNTQVCILHCVLIINACVELDLYQFYYFFQTNLDLDHIHMKALLDGNLSTTSGIEQCIEAADALQKCMHSEIHPCKRYDIIV